MWTRLRGQDVYLTVRSFFVSGSLDERIVRWRHAVMVLALSLIPLLRFYSPPLWGLGCVLFIWDMRRGGWQRIQWRRDWVLLLPLLLYLKIAVGGLWSIDTKMAFQTISRTGLYALAPWMILGLRPRRSWGSALIVGSLLFFVVALCCSFYLMDRPVEFYTFYYPEQYLTPSEMRRYAFNYVGYTFSPSYFLSKLGNYPAGIGFCAVVALGIAVHRLFLDRPYGWKLARRLALILVLLTSILMTNSKASILCLICAAGYALLRHIFFNPRVRWYWRLGFACFGIIALVGLMQVTRFKHIVTDTQELGGLEQYLANYPRSRAMVRFWEIKDRYIPWGTGTASSDSLFREIWEYDPVLRKDKMLKLHNHYYESLVEFGIIGLLLTLASLFWPLIRWRRFSTYHQAMWIVLWIILFFEPVIYGGIFIAPCALYYPIWSSYCIYRSEYQNERDMLETI